MEYMDWWEYWSGRVLEEEDEHAVVTDQSQKPLRYPLQLNLVAMVCQLHASGLIGDTQGRDTPIGLVAKPRDDRGGSEAAMMATQVVSDFLEESAMESEIDEAALSAMVFGGAVFKVCFDPTSEMGVRLEPRWVENFRPVWYPGNRNRLAEVFCSHVCDVAQAEAAYNVDIGLPKYESNRVLVLEHWTETDYKVTVNDRPARYPDGAPMQGANPWGFVPFVYMPSYRMASFYGESVIPSIKGLQNEVNLRLADLGDAVAGAVHRILWVRNRHKGAKGLSIDAYKILDLGINPPGYEPPDIGALDPPQIQAGAVEFLEKLLDMLGRIGHTPPVVYGVDEGSQRSALTLAFRMYPYVSHITRYRRSWSWGWKQVGKQALRMMQIKGLNGITEQHCRQLWKVEYAPIMPRDREQLVNETVILTQTMLRSPEKALEMLADIPKEEIGEELERIKKFQELRARFAQQAEMQQMSEGPAIKMDQPIARPSTE
jgi:hypothetical protein